ncbi:zinc finger, C3HC4 type (RING finger) domain-containing protein [Toxoplasma gondii VAND]|uniref:Zinc finger, C3HC4 type (RING finger) domain-containing protein n=1 Tax=Toxoplasma gondii VAND TaxID=933077 RepID=A0A086QBZ5_TOXGO|nr:zinc finger, C3HC4 type (RING finger) domain-containing protein [Toxoplasma gondii VAND]
MEADTPPVPGITSQSLGGSSPRSTWGASGTFTASRLHGPFASSPLPFNGHSHSSSLSSSPVPLPSASSSSVAAPLLGAFQHSFSSPSVSNSLLPSLSSSSFSSLSSSASPSLHASWFPPAFFSGEHLSMAPSSSSLPPSSFPLGSASPAGWTAQSLHAPRQSGETGGEVQREPRQSACSESSSGVSRRRTRDETSRMAPIFAEGKTANAEGEAREEEVARASHAGHECPICLEKFECGEMRRPKVLTCGHSICFLCILRILSTGDGSAGTALHPRRVSPASASSCFFLGMFGEASGRQRGLTGDEEFDACMRSAAHCSFFQCPLCRQESRIAADNLALLPSGDAQTPKARRQGERRTTQGAFGASAEAKQRRPTEGNLHRVKRPLWTDAQQENRDSRTYCKQHPNEATVAYCRLCGLLVCSLCFAGEDSPHYLHPRTSLACAVALVADLSNAVLLRLKQAAERLRSDVQRRLRVEQMLEDAYRLAFQRGVQRVEELRCHLETYVTCAASCLADALSSSRAQSLEMHRRRRQEEERLLRVASTAAVGLESHVARLLSASSSSSSSSSSSLSLTPLASSFSFPVEGENREEMAALSSGEGQPSARDSPPVTGRPAKRANAGAVRPACASSAASAPSSSATDLPSASSGGSEARGGVCEARVRVLASLLPALRYAEAAERFVQQTMGEEHAREEEREEEIAARCETLLHTRLESLQHLAGDLAVLWKTPRGRAPTQQQQTEGGEGRQRARTRTGTESTDGERSRGRRETEGGSNRNCDDSWRKKRDRGEEEEREEEDREEEEMDGMEGEGGDLDFATSSERGGNDKEEKKVAEATTDNMLTRNRRQMVEDSCANGTSKGGNAKSNRAFSRIPYDVCLQGGLVLPLLELVYRDWPRDSLHSTHSENSRGSSLPPPPSVAVSQTHRSLSPASVSPSSSFSSSSFSSSFSSVSSSGVCESRASFASGHAVSSSSFSLGSSSSLPSFSSAEASSSLSSSSSVSSSFSSSFPLRDSSPPASSPSSSSASSLPFSSFSPPSL